ncbi:MAG: proteasome activator [Acidimicrobiia bacterium]
MAENQPRRDPSSIDDPAKLLRFGSMAAATLNEVRQVNLDEEGRRRLHELYRSTLEELGQLLSEDLQEELHEDVEFLTGEDTPSMGELRVAQARLIGWLDGLFRGMQASTLNRQMAAQLEALRRQALSDGEQQEKPTSPGYL